MESTIVISPPTVNVGGLAMPPTQAIDQSTHPVHISRSSTSRLEHLREVKAFQAKLQTLSSNHGGPNLMTHSLGDGIAGVVNGVQIPFQDL